MTEIDVEHEEPRAYPWWSPRGWDWSLNHWVNRLVYSMIAGGVVNLTTGGHTLGTVVTVVLFVLTTAIITALRR